MAHTRQTTDYSKKQANNYDSFQTVSPAIQLVQIQLGQKSFSDIPKKCREYPIDIH